MDDNNLRTLQFSELEILKSVTDLCDQNGITYFLMDGTLLGAVRHKGFIPWDDDVDIGIPREDYERFLNIGQKAFSGTLKLKNYRFSNNYDKLVTRIVNEKIRLYHDSYEQKKMEPAWIDVFPLDGMPKNKLLFQIHKYHFLVVRLFYHFSCFDHSVNLTRKDRSMLQKILIWFGKTFHIGRNWDTRKILDKLEHILKKYDCEKSRVWVNAYSSYLFKETYQKTWFSNSLRVPFEQYDMNIPADYDAILTHLYGDYMTPPPKGQEEKHHITRIEFDE